MKSKKLSLFLSRVLVSSIVVLMIGFLGLGIRVFATAHATRIILVSAFVIPAVLYFMLRRSTRELTAYLRFRGPSSLFPRSTRRG